MNKYLIWNPTDQNGRSYNLEQLNEAVEQFSNKIKKQGLQYGELGHPDNFNVCLQNVSHSINSIRAEYGKLPRKLKKRLKTSKRIYKKLKPECYKINITLLNTNKGKVASFLLKDHKLKLGIRGSGIVDTEGIVTLKEIYSFDLIQKDHP